MREKSVALGVCTGDGSHGDVDVPIADGAGVGVRLARGVGLEPASLSTDLFLLMILPQYRSQVSTTSLKIHINALFRIAVSLPYPSRVGQPTNE